MVSSNASRPAASTPTGCSTKHGATSTPRKSRAGQTPKAPTAPCTTPVAKALWAILANQGLRSTTRGGHLAVYHAVIAQLDPPMGQDLRPFDRMRRQRHDAEYPQIDTPDLHPDDLPKIRVIVDIAERILDNMSVY